MQPNELLEQYRAFQHEGGAFDVSRRTRLRITGRDRLRFINNLCTAKLNGLVAGSGAEVFFLDVKGHIVGHGVVYVADEELWIEAAPNVGAALLEHFAQFVISEKIAFEDITSTTESWLACGPLIAELLALSLEPNRSLPLDRLGHVAVTQSGQSLRIAKSDLLGPPGILVVRDKSDASIGRDDSAWKLLTTARLPSELLESIRIEQGCPEFGRDIDSRNLPQEVGRDRLAISFTKGCYLGQETVARLDALGHVNRRLVRLRFETDTLPPPEFRIEQGGKVIGRVTSSAWSPSTGHPIALAYVRTGFDTPGTRLSTSLGTAEVLA